MKDDDELNKEEKEIKEGNKFDKIWKENMFGLFVSLLEKQFDLRLKKYEELTPKFQVTIEREVDFLRLVVDENDNQFIIHIEIQTVFEEHFILRVKEYNALITRRYKLPVRTFVFYLGVDHQRIRTKLPKEMIFSGFNMLSFCALSHQDFISSSNPEEIILAILTDLEKEPSYLIIKEIIEKLESTVQSKAKLKKYISQLQVLSQLRNLDTKVMKIASNMSLFPDIRKNAAVAPIIQAIEEEKKEMRQKINTIEQEKSIIEQEKSIIEQEKSKLQYALVKHLLENKEISLLEISEIANTSISYVEKVQSEMKKQ